MINIDMTGETTVSTDPVAHDGSEHRVKPGQDHRDQRHLAKDRGPTETELKESVSAIERPTVQVQRRPTQAPRETGQNSASRQDASN